MRRNEKDANKRKKNWKRSMEFTHKHVQRMINLGSA